MYRLGDADAEVIKLKLIAQETHFERRKTSVADMPLLRENEEKGNYDIILSVKPEGSQQGFIFNTYHVDPDVRAILDQADFRRALSIAIDREAINQTAYYGLGKAGHGFSDPNVYDPEIDGKWAEFDLDKASRLEYGAACMTHAMLFTGVDIVRGKPRRWRVENSWGDKNGKKGFYIMNDSWFNEHMFEIAARRSALPTALQEAVDLEPIVLPPWDPMGSLA